MLTALHVFRVNETINKSLLSEPYFTCTASNKNLVIMLILFLGEVLMYILSLAVCLAIAICFCVSLVSGVCNSVCYICN